MQCRIVPFLPGRRPTDEDTRPGFGSSDSAAFVTSDDSAANRAVLLVELTDVPADAVVEADVSFDGVPVPGWKGRRIEVTGQARERIVLSPNDDFAGVDLSLTAGFMRKARVDVRFGDASDTAFLDVCELANMGSLYTRIIDKLVAPDTTRQAQAAGVADPGVSYHPWFPVLKIGGDKAALYTAALVADIVDKEDHLTDPAWLLRVGVYLELLTCIGIFEAVKDDMGDLLSAEERAAFEHSDVFAEVRARIQPDTWREVWDMRKITFPRFGHPRTGPVSALNLLRKKNATLRFLHVHHEDLKHAIELAGPNRFNAQETWQRVFRDAERAVLRQVAAAFPEMAYLPGPARERVLWQRVAVAGQQGLYATACNQYRASMNHVADWAKEHGLMDNAGEDCVPLSASLLDALMRNESQVAVLQRQDGLSPNLTVTEPAVAAEPTTEEIEALLHDVAIFHMMPASDIHTLALGARPLFMGPTQRFVVEGHEGTSMFLVGEGEVEVRLRKDDGTDWLVETMGRGEVVGEMSLLTGDKRAATVRAVDEAVVYEIGKPLYEPLVQAHPEWVDELARVMEERLERRQARIAELADPKRGKLRERIRRNFFGDR